MSQKPCSGEEKMSEVQQAMCLLICAFNKYSGKEGDKFTLTKAELKTLIENEMQGMLVNVSNKEEMDKIFSDLDVNKDNTIDFKEFVCMVSCVTCICHEFFTQK